MLKSTNFTFKKILGIVCVFAIILGAIYTPIALAVKAASTVTVTFVDTLNNTENSISGTIGDTFSYPTDPVDQNGEKWFMGWYTDEALKTEFTDTMFGEDDVILYSKWASEYKTVTQGFEDYKYDAFSENNTSGNVTKSNKNYFFEGSVKQSDITYGNSVYAVKTVWDSTMTKIPEDPNTYNAKDRFSTIDAKILVGTDLVNGVAYKVTFKYKFDKADTAVKAVFRSAQMDNIWAYATVYDGINLNTASTEWQEASYTTRVGGEEAKIWLHFWQMEC